MTTGTIIGRRRVRSLTNLPAARRTSRSSASTSRTPFGERLLERRRDQVACLVEQILGLGRVHPAAGDDVGPGEHLAGLDVDGDDDDHDALLAEHATVADHALADVADDAVDVHVPGGHPADVCRARRR